MPLYRYRARDRNGGAVTGTLVADTPAQLEEELTNRGLYLISTRKASRAPKLLARKIPRKELIAFTSQLAVIAGSGIPILEGLEDMGAQTHNPTLRETISNLIFELRQGRSLSEAMSSNPDVFGALYVNSVRSAEETGNLESVLERLVGWLEWEEEVASRIRQASAYPAILLCMLGVVFFILVGFVLPRFASIFARKGFPLPLPTKIVLGGSIFVRANWHWILLCVVLSAVVIKLAARTSTGRKLIDWMKVNLPIVGDLLRKIALTRFAHTLATTVAAGVEIISALRLAGMSTGNTLFIDRTKDATERIGTGQDIASSLRATNLFPPLFIRMVAVGERTGSLAIMLDRASSFYSREIKPALERIITLFEASVTVAMGIAVGLVAMSIFIPLYKMLVLIRR